MSREDYLRTEEAKQLIMQINIAGGICIGLNVLQILFLLGGASIVPLSVIIAALLIVIGAVLVVTKHHIAAWALLVCSVLGLVAAIVMSRNFGGILYVAAAAVALRASFEIDKGAQQYTAADHHVYEGRGNRKKGKKSGKKRNVSEQEFTPAPSIDPAAIAAYRPMGLNTTVLAPSDGEAPYVPQNSAGSDHQPYPDVQPAPAVSAAQYQEPEPAPAVSAASGPEPAAETPAAAPATEAEQTPAAPEKPADPAQEEAAAAEVPAEEIDTVMIPELHEDESVAAAEQATPAEEPAAPEEPEAPAIYGYKIDKDGFYGYHFLDGEETVCTVEGVFDSNTPVSIQGGDEHWYFYNDWDIRVMPGQRKYIINYSDDMTNGIFEYKERDHYIMNYKAESLEAEANGDETVFSMDGKEVARLKYERGTFMKEGKDGTHYTGDIRVKITMDESVGVIRNLIMAYPMLYFG